MKKKLILVGVVLIVFLVFVGPFINKAVKRGPPMKSNYWHTSECNPDGPTMMSYFPLEVDQLEFIEPMGAVTGSHVLPVDHGYLHLKDAFLEDGETENTQQFEVRSPADGVIVLVGNIVQWHSDRVEELPTEDYHVDYDVAIEHSCTLSSYFVHVDTLREDILREANFKEGGVPGHLHASVFIPVEEGEVIGTVSGEILDYSIHRSDITLPGFIYPKHYADLAPKVHSVDILNYFDDSLRTQIESKMIRKDEPRWGKIDYDVEGKLVGNWFKENTRYHKGIIKDRYWDGHLAITYDHIFPHIIRVSTGDFNDKHAQFAVVGNAPDPATVSIGEVVKYELVNFWYQSPSMDYWRGRTYVDDLEPMPSDEIQGVFLFKVLEGNKLKVEVFPGKIADEVSDFTDGALIYER